MVSPFIPSSFIYGDSPSGAAIETIVQATRAPTSSDSQYTPGTLWVSVEPVGSGSLYFLAGFSSGVPQWELLGTATGDVVTLSDTSGTLVTPTAGGNIQLLGTTNQISVTAGSHTLTFALVGPYTPATYTAHGVLVGEGTSSIVATTVGTDGQVLTGNSAADPAFAAIGTKSGLTAHGVVLAEGASAFTATAAGTNGQVLLGGTADPAFGTLTTSTGIAYTTGNNALAVDVKTDGFAVVNQASGSANLAAQNMYIDNNGASLITYTLPAVVGSGNRGVTIRIVGFSAGGWKVAQNASQQIFSGSSSTTAGTSGSVSSTNHNQCITLISQDDTGNNWVIADSSGGAFTFV